MGCPKCNGLMMMERFSDLFLIFYACNSITCASILDRTICANRRKSLAIEPQAQPVAPR